MQGIRNHSSQCKVKGGKRVAVCVRSIQNFENNLSTEVKIDGNRRILAYLVNSKDVAVRIEDMSGKYD